MRGAVDMITLNVAIKDQEEVKEFVGKASRLPFDVNLGHGRIQVDAKSIMGVLYLGINRMLRLEANTDDEGYLKDAMEKFIVSGNSRELQRAY